MADVAAIGLTIVKEVREPREMRIAATVTTRFADRGRGRAGMAGRWLGRRQAGE